MYEVIFFTTNKGICPVDELLDILTPKVQAKVEKWMFKLQEHGPNLPRPFADVVDGKIRELRVSFSPNTYRFLYFFHGKRIVITHGFVKKTKQVPMNEIDKSRKYMLDYLARHV